MPWDRKGGGSPWGGGGSNGGGGNGDGDNGNPWGRRPGGGGGGGFGGGQQPPDVEELLRKGQERVRRLLPGGIGGGKGIFLVVLVLFGIWVASGFYVVQPSQQGVVLRFGQLVATTQPGLNYHLPAPIESALTPDVTQINRIEVGFRSGVGSRGNTGEQDVKGESLMVTGDENIVDIDFSLFWKIKDASQYLFTLRDPEMTAKLAAESVMREIVGQTKIQETLTQGREAMQNRAKREIQALLDDYQSGIEITSVNLKAIAPPEQVVDAFNEVQRAEADKERVRNEAEAYRNDIVPRARGEAARLKQEAQAYRDQVVAQAEGDADRFNSVYAAYSRSKDVTTQRIYIETMQQVLGNVNKVIIDSDGTNGVVPYLPLPEIQKKSNATGTGAQ